MAMQHPSGNQVNTGYLVGPPPDPHEMVFALYHPSLTERDHLPYFFSPKSAPFLFKYLRDKNKVRDALKWNLVPLGLHVSIGPRDPAVPPTNRPIKMNMGYLPFYQTSAEIKLTDLWWQPAPEGPGGEWPAISDRVPPTSKRHTGCLFWFLFCPELSGGAPDFAALRIGLTYSIHAALYHTLDALSIISGIGAGNVDRDTLRCDAGDNIYLAVGPCHAKSRFRVGHDCPTPLHLSNTAFGMLHP